MSYVPIFAGTTIATTAAAAAQARKMREEEEKLTTYNKDDMEDWEFKIVRSTTGKFKNLQIVQQLCQEEAQHGWEMVEKFDNGRIRFKRRTQKRSNDQFAKTDPYRSRVGMGEGGLVLTVLGVIFGSLGIILATIYLIGLNT